MFGGTYDPEEGGWATRLRNYLEPEDFIVYNCGVSGDDTQRLLERFEMEAKTREPQLIIIAVGINDSQYENNKENARISEEKFTENIETLIKKAREFTENIVFVGITRVDESQTMPIPWSDRNKNYDNTNIARYDSIIEFACCGQGIPYLDTSELLSVNDLEDGLHPNPQGHQKIFEEVKRFLSGIDFIKL